MAIHPQQRVQAYLSAPSLDPAVLEVAILAALSTGQASLADALLVRLDKVLPNSRESKRLALLRGKAIEARTKSGEAERWYEAALQADESDYPARERLVTLLAHSTAGQGKTDPAALLEYLEGVYDSPAGWSALSDIYSSLGMHAQALTAQSHCLLLHSSANSVALPIVLLKHAELAHTAGERDVALAEYLRVVEILGGVEGVGRRAALGALSILSKQLQTFSLSGAELKKKEKLKEALTAAVSGAYSTEKGADGTSRTAVLKWLGSS